MSTFEELTGKAETHDDEFSTEKDCYGNTRGMIYVSGYYTLAELKQKVVELEYLEKYLK